MPSRWDENRFRTEALIKLALMGFSLGYPEIRVSSVPAREKGIHGFSLITRLGS